MKSQYKSRGSNEPVLWLRNNEAMVTEALRKERETRRREGHNIARAWVTGALMSWEEL